jgi:Transcriptional activator TraM
MAVFELHFISQKSHDHIGHNPHKRPQPRLVIWLGDDVEADRIRVVHQVPDPKTRVETIISLPAFTDELFPQDIASMLKSRLTFAEAIETPAPDQSSATGILFPVGQPGRMNDGVKAFRSQLQKELGLSIGPKDPLLALWVSQKGLLEQNAAQQQKLLSEFQSALGKSQTAWSEQAKALVQHSLNVGPQAAQNSTALLLQEAARKVV